MVFKSAAQQRRIVDFAPIPASPVPSETSHPSRQDEEAFCAWLFRAAGLDASDYRPETLRRRLPACLRAVRAGTCSQAKQALQLEPALLPKAISAMIIGVTEFFRDAMVFDHLTYSALCHLRRLQRPPRIWSAGCSSGEEMYSVAILLAEMNLLEGAYLVGTDCRAQAIARARDASYSDAALSDVPQPWVDKYFTRHCDRWHIVSRLRRSVHWRRADVTQTVEPAEWDVILCRNMTMYLRPQVAARLWEQLASSLRPGGFLVLGKAERPTGDKRLAAVAPCIYRRQREGLF